MKEWYVSYTYLDIMQVPDNWGYDEVMKWAISNRPADNYNDIEIFEVERND